MRNHLILGFVLASTFASLSLAEETAEQADTKASKASATKQAETQSKAATAKKTNTKANTSEEPNPAIRLESVFVGDKEQPAISYFIPWQGVGAPDKLHWNVEEKHDKALELVDREIMLRSIHFYGEMNLENSK